MAFRKYLGRDARYDAWFPAPRLLAPPDPGVTKAYFDTTDNVLRVWDGASWKLAGIPVGGAPHDVLAKASGDDFDMDWETPSGGGGGGSTKLVDLGGDGSDGAVVLDGVTTNAFSTLAGTVYTLTRNAQVTSVSVSGGASVVPAGFSILLNEFGASSFDPTADIDFTGNVSFENPITVPNDFLGDGFGIIPSAGNDRGLSLGLRGTTGTVDDGVMFDLEPWWIDKPWTPTLVGYNNYQLLIAGRIGMGTLQVGGDVAAAGTRPAPVDNFEVLSTGGLVVALAVDNATGAAKLMAPPAITAGDHYLVYNAATKQVRLSAIGPAS